MSLAMHTISDNPDYRIWEFYYHFNDDEMARHSMKIESDEIPAIMQTMQELAQYSE